MNHLTTNADVVELFAGPGGSSQGLRDAGFTGSHTGIEWDTDACNTAEAAGHRRLQADVSTINPHRFAKTQGQIASPPCQGFSMSGKGLGRLDAELLLAALEDVNTEADIVAAIARLHGDMRDDRSVLALEPLRFALALTPSWVMWEQVPAVLPIWEACAGVLRRIGYTVDTGILQAEQFGVPQTRRRAILVAHAPWVETAAQLPAPTHSRYHPRHPGKLDGGLRKWVSIADAFGWNPDEHSHIQFAGAGATAQFTAQQRPREVTEPAHTITGKGTAAWVYRNGNQANAAKRGLHQPAPTIHFGARSNKVEWMEAGKADDVKASGVRVSVQEAAVLQSFPVDYPWRGTKTEQYRMVGDAVPPRLAAAILKPILEAVSRDSPRAVAA